MTWNEATLEKWLRDPDVLVPDMKMDFHVPKAQERCQKRNEVQSAYELDYQ